MGSVLRLPSDASFHRTGIEPLSYTHYWRVRNTTEWLKTWPQLIADVQRIADEAGVPLNYDGDEEDGIELNGSESSCETFILEPEATGFSFCKTARRPYDLIVTAILLRAWQLAGKAISLRYVAR
jgi:hypothetical protein